MKINNPVINTIYMKCYLSRIQIFFPIPWWQWRIRTWSSHANSVIQIGHSSSPLDDWIVFQGQINCICSLIGHIDNFQNVYLVIVFNEDISEYSECWLVNWLNATATTARVIRKRIASITHRTNELFVHSKVWIVGSDVLLY